MKECKSCKSKDLKIKWHSNDNIGWVHCDNCGRYSTPVNISLDYDGPDKKSMAKIIERWDEEQKH